MVPGCPVPCKFPRSDDLIVSMSLGVLSCCPKVRIDLRLYSSLPTFQYPFKKYKYKYMYIDQIYRKSKISNKGRPYIRVVSQLIWSILIGQNVDLAIGLEWIGHLWTSIPSSSKIPIPLQADFFKNLIFSPHFFESTYHKSQKPAIKEIWKFFPA